MPVMFVFWIYFLWNFNIGNTTNFNGREFGNISRTGRQNNILNLGVCKILLNRDCPNEEIKYFLYTRRHPLNAEEITVGHSLETSNILQTSFRRKLPTKIVIHGYNSNMFLNALIEVKNQYLMRNDMNIFAIDWGSIAEGPCYPAAVYNSRIAGKCSALLIERLRAVHVENIHVIGFSLGAHVSGFIANALAPYKIARITGLDPAMPGFATVPNNQKLDASDAEFVDVIHTNAFFQGQVQESGHLDFFVNGGVVQPGCWADNRFLACNHHRAPFYFAESINSEKGFWAWPCTNYFSYLTGRCPPREPQITMGDFTNKSATGMHLVITDSVSPFAVGKFTGPTIEIFKQKFEQTRISNFERYKQIMMMDCTRNYNTGKCGEFFNDVFDSDDNNILYDVFP